MSTKTKKMLEEIIAKQNNKLKHLEALCKKQTITLHEKEQKQSFFENILIHMPGHVYWLDRNNVYLGCNEEHAKTAGLQSRFDIVGKTNLDMPWRDEAEVLDNLNNLVMSSGEPQIQEESALINNVYRTYLSKKVPLRDSTNEIIGVLCISIEITDLKKMEGELRMAKEKAEAANYIMTEFISNMGHILVTPFSTITGVATMLLYGYSDKYLELKPLFEELMQGCTDWEKVYTQVIKATSLKEMELKLETFSITKELIAIGSIMEPSIGSKKLKLIIKPFKPDNEDLIETDKLKFHLIFIDFLSNAIKFTEKGKVTVSIAKLDSWFTIQVADTGIGIPPDKLDFIFQQYTMLSRAQKHGAHFNGVGAGLFLAKQRAKLLDAEIFVTSKVGKGSTFTLRIPEHPLKNSY